jgi:beta-lactamase regulating signal transducer with metallopeptidase domain/Tol biopolymer transport system component
MNVQALNDWSASATALAAAIVWQSTLLALLVACVCAQLRRAAPALRYWCWQIVALKLLLMPWWIVTIPVPAFLTADTPGSIPAAVHSSAAHAAAGAAAPITIVAPPAADVVAVVGDTPGSFAALGQLSGRSWLVLAWVGGVAWQVGCMVLHQRRLRRLLRRATTAQEPHLLAMIAEVAAQLGLRRRPEVVLTEEGAPFVCGLLRPVLALPRELLATLDADQWRDVVLHELGHVSRRDLWWGWSAALARLVYFFHPVAHWVHFRIRLERELACDQLAMTIGGRSAADYAEVLVQVVSHASMPPALAMNSLEGLSTFWKRRLTMLLAASRSSPRLSRFTGLAVVTAGLVVCLVPTVIHTVAVEAQSQPAQAEGKARGRIYVSAMLRYKADGDDEEKDHSLIIAIDPATGAWQKMTDRGHDCRVSPDGQTLVFNRHQNGLWNCDTGGSNNPGKIFDKSGRPNWSPDGRHLVVTKQELVKERDSEPRPKAPVWKDETWRLEADGRNPLQLPIPDTDSVCDWSVDGQWFVTCSDRHPPYGSGYQLYVMKTDGSAQRRLTEGGLNVYARFSPDGKKILWLRQTAKAGSSIWTMDTDGKNAREIVKEVGLASPNGAFWSPDGKQIAVSLFNWEVDEKGGRFRRADSDAANARLEIMDADGSNRRHLPLQGAKVGFIGSLGDWR